MGHYPTLGEFVCALTAIGNIGAWAFYAGRLSQLTRDIDARVEKLEIWRDKHTD